MPKLAYTILYVQDVERSLNFYEAAFGFKRGLLTPDSMYGELETGNTVLSFAQIELAKSNLKDGFIESTNSSKPFGIEIGITTEDVSATMQTAIDAGATLLEPAITKPWGQIVGYVRDPDGFLLEICTPM